MKRSTPPPGAPGMPGMNGTPQRDAPYSGSGAIGSQAQVLPFRRRPYAARRRRPSLFARMVLPFLGALLVVGAPAAIAIWVLASPRFGLREVSVEGGRRVSKAWVVATLEPLFGRNLVLLPLSEVEARLASHPWLSTIEARKVLPDRLQLVVAEREPAALLRAGDELRYLDAEGLPFAPCDPLDPAGSMDLLLVSAGADVQGLGYRRALALAAELAAAQPSWAAGLSEVEVLGEEDFRLVTAALPFPLLVRAGGIRAGVARLEPLVPEILRRYPQRVGAVDLRFSRRVVVQPIDSISISPDALEPAAPPRTAPPRPPARAGAPAAPVVGARAA